MSTEQPIPSYPTEQDATADLLFESSGECMRFGAMILAVFAALFVAACGNSDNAVTAPSDDQLIRELFQNAATYTRTQNSHAMNDLLCKPVSGGKVESPMIDELNGEIDSIEFVGAGHNAAQVAAKSSKVWNGSQMIIHFDVAKVGDKWMFSKPGGCVGGSTGDGATLTIAVVGNGAQSAFLESKPAGLHCQGNDEPCMAAFDHGTVVDIHAAAFSSTHFVSWGGACHGSDSTCRLTMDGNQSVIATFE